MDEQEIGWQIVNEYGEIVASGPVTVAEMAADTAQLLNADKE